ncbi:uncharacterized protein EDB93DRAFT_1239862 [Suillus bovinus]|uniref:uncharacterized protein n=1 Tax=Suillus bovinus TaxID=48563 RepID=UPI001B885BD9|nr:uncharacterized protein EDB93DRAFT_1239862 [Suillus bovinus]KAG2153067.1 hypothetical protein EDB93DRAFT_1239862 [Suillus bovinus]
MPQCPLCRKIMEDHTSVARHMSQPRSGCNTWLEDIIKLNSLIPPLDPANIEHHIPHEPELGGEAMVVDFGDVAVNSGGEVTKYYPDPPLAYQDGYTFLNLFDSDENSVHHKNNLYYPFSGRRDWQVAAWLLRSGLSMSNIDSFLSLEMVKDLTLSFSSAKELQGRAEMLPSGPCWMSKVIPTLHATKSPVVLYWRDPLECIASVFNNPLFHNCIDFRPRKVYTTTEKQCRVYTEWMMGNDAWDMQAAIPSGTNITALTGDRVAHPLLISLANIHMNIRLKSSSGAFVLTALLPVLKFVHKKKQMKGVLEDRLIHQCLDIVLEPLKQAARHGIMLSDPIGNNWILAEPSRFFTPEDLHHIHKEFWDHDTQWLICAVGESEIDFRFSILQPITGISKLKQVTGRCHLCANAAPGVLTAIHALMQFRYCVQSPCINDDDIRHISGALDKFHSNKDLIIAAGARRGKGNRPISNWHIPKLELMQNIVPSIRNSGVIRQWSADVTEHAHVTEIKDPARATNNHNYDPQICRHLDQAEKCRRFELATSLLDAKQTTEQLENTDIDADDANANADTPIELSAVQQLPCRPVISYFAIARALQYRPVGSIPLPLCSFVVGRTAFHIAYDPSIRKISIDEVAVKFSLPDLRPAIADFIQHEATCGDQHIHAISGPRRGAHTATLPFDQVQVWFKVRLQETEFYDAHTIRPAQTLNCTPPCDPWNLGHYDTAIIQTSAGFSWPSSGLSGHTVAQIRLIMRPIGKSDTSWSWKDQFLCYVQHFDISPDRDPTTQLHLLKRSKHSNGVRMGDVIPLSQLRVPINLVPRFGATADKCHTVYNSMEHAAEFWLNEYWEKNTFFALSAWYLI